MLKTYIINSRIKGNSAKMSDAQANQATEQKSSTSQDGETAGMKSGGAGQQSTPADSETSGNLTGGQVCITLFR
jgi:hypothetical protein